MMEIPPAAAAQGRPRAARECGLPEGAAAAEARRRRTCRAEVERTGRREWGGKTDVIDNEARPRASGAGAGRAVGGGVANLTGALLMHNKCRV